MKLSLITALIALTLTACTVSKNQAPSVSYGQGIIGGEAVADSDPVASMTGMLIDTKQGSLCTASILNDEWLLTAAHCVNDSEAGSLVVAFKGSFQDIAAGKGSKKDMRRVQAFQVHPKYTEMMKQIQDIATAAKAAGRNVSSSDIDNTKDWGDIALVHLSGKVPSDKVAATMLPASLKLKKRDNVTLAGYGQTGSSESSSYGSLNKVDVQIAEALWGTTEVVMDQRSGKGACHGDSGGPAYIRSNGQLYLFGITSRGMGDGTGPQCTHFAVYTNAVSYSDWIAGIIGH